MRVTILGTSAWDSLPAPWCGCSTCESARRNGGREIRRRTSCWIDDGTLIDFGPDIAEQCRAFGIDLRRMKRLIQTHSHCDHLAPELLMGHRLAGESFRLICGRESEERILRVWGAEGRALGFRSAVGFGGLGIELVRARHGERIEDGALSVLPLRAAHVDDEEAFNYLLTGSDGRKLLILFDTGVWKEDSCRLVEGCGADAAIVEATLGTAPARGGDRRCHLSCEEALEFLDSLQAAGALKPGAPRIGLHFSHAAVPPHPELVNRFGGRLVIAYDGMQLEL